MEFDWQMELVWEEREIKYNIWKGIHSFERPANVVTSRSCPLSHTRAALPMDLPEKLAALGHLSQGIFA